MLNCIQGILNLNGLFCNFEHFIFVLCFVTNCQKGSLLGSKTLGTKCIRTSICNVLANHDQNLESRFRLLKVCLFVKLESSNCRIYLSKSTRLNRSKIRLDQSNLVHINFLQNFPTQPKLRLTCRVLYITPSIKGKTLATFQMSLMCYVLNLL